VVQRRAELVDAPLGHGRVHIVFDVGVAARQEIVDRGFRLNDAAVMTVAGRPAGLAQEHELEAGQEDGQQDDQEDDRQLGAVAAALVLGELIHEQVCQQAAQGCHNDQQADGVDGFLLREQPHRVGRQDPAEQPMPRDIALAQGQHRGLGQRVDADAGEEEDGQQQGVEPAEERMPAGG